jgi:hypothetical protein
MVCRLQHHIMLPPSSDWTSTWWLGQQGPPKHWFPTAFYMASQPRSPRPERSVMVCWILKCVGRTEEWISVLIYEWILYQRSRDNSVGIVLGYELDNRGFRVRFPAGAVNFSLHPCIQNGSGTHPASYPMGTRGSFPGVKRPGREADHPPPSSAEVKNAWSYTSIPPIRLHGMVLS